MGERPPGKTRFREPSPDALRAVVELSAGPGAASPELRLRSSIRKGGQARSRDTRNTARASFAPGTALSTSQFFRVEGDEDEDGYGYGRRSTSFAHTSGDEDFFEHDLVHTAQSPTRGTRFSDTYTEFEYSDMQTGFGGGTRTTLFDTQAISPGAATSAIGSPESRRASTRNRHPRALQALSARFGRDSLRSRNASNARQLVKDLTRVETEVARLLEDRGKEINPQNGRISTAKWLKRPEVGTEHLVVSQMHEDSIVCRLLFSMDGQRLVTVSSKGPCKIFRNTLEDLDNTAGAGLPANIDQGSELWELEQEIVGHPKQCFAAALEQTKADFFVVVGLDRVIRLFSEGVVNGPLSENGVAPLQELRLVLGRRQESSTGTLEEVIKRLRHVLRFEPMEARRLGVLENPEQCRDLKRTWVLASSHEGCINEFARNLEHEECFMQIFDCDLHPRSSGPGTLLLGTGWANGDVRWYLARKGAKRQTENLIAYDSWEWVQYQRMQSSADAIFACKFSPTGDQFVSASKDWTICVFAYPRRGIRWGLGQCFLNAQADDEITRLESSEAADLEFQLVSRLPGHNAPILGLGFHPSGETIASVGADAIGMLWTLKEPDANDDVCTGKWNLLTRGTVAAAGQRKENREWNSLGFLCGHREYVTSCAFRADGVLLATASRDCTVQLWRMPRHFAHSRVSHHLFKCIDKLKCRSEVSCIGFGRRACKSILWAGTFMGEVYSWNTETRLQCAADLQQGSENHYGAFSSTHPLDELIGARQGARHVSTARTGSASGIWSRMSTPYDIAMKREEENHEEPFEPIRFAAVDPWETRVCKAERLLVGAKKKGNGTLRSAIKTGNREQDERLLDQALRLMHRTVDIVFKEEPLLASTVEFDQSGLIALIEASQNPLDPKECVAVLSKLAQKLLPIVIKGEVKKFFPQALRGRKNEHSVLFRRREIEALLLEGDRQQEETLKVSKQKFKPLPPIERNDHGQSLAKSLVDETPCEAKVILTRKFVQKITPQLSWMQKNADRAAQKVAQRLLVGLDPNKPLPNDEFTNYCCLLFDLNFLYRRVADIVQAIHAEKLSKKADVLSLNNSSGTAAVAVSFAGTEEECDTLKWWSGLTDRPLQTDRVQLPLLPSNTPTWIGIIFSPGKPSMLKTFSVHVALGGGKGEAEPIKYVIPGVPEWTHEANSGPGIAFCCKIMLWDQHKSAPGHVLYEGEETYVDDRHFQEFAFNLEDAGLRLESYEEVLIALTTENCESRSKKGHAWVSGLGEHNQRGQVPYELRKGIFALSGRRVLGKGKMNCKWEKLSDVMACKIVYCILND